MELKLKTYNHGINSKIAFLLLERIPSILEPNFDLPRLNVRENGTLTYELLTANRTGFRAFMIKPLESFNLLRCITDILSVIH